MEKSNDGELTIGSASGEGKLTANGGDYAAGIGGSFARSGSDITITGGEVNANGGICGAGIGGGQRGSGTNITISGGKVTARGGGNGAGIGAGDDHDQKAIADNIKITGSANVSAIGGRQELSRGAGPAIGNCGKYPDIPGAEVEPDTSGLYTTGKVERKSGDGTVLETITGTVEPPVEPEKSAAEEPAAREPLYRVTNLEGKNLPYQAETADGVLTVTASADGAILTGALRALGYLANQGIEKITFTDGTHSATIVLADLIAKGEAEDIYVLTLGAANTLTLNGEAVDF